MENEKTRAPQAHANELTLVKIGGNVIDDEAALAFFLKHFARIPGKKILVHGGGKLATELAKKLDIPQQMVDGRRITDAETLKIAVMVYAGLINKKIVANLSAQAISAVGLTGADFNLIRSKKRENRGIDYGFVGDIEEVNTDALIGILEQGHVPILAPITHDEKGQLLNTNADTIANAVATALAKRIQVSLIYTFEKSGVLLNVDDEKSLLPKINFEQFQALQKEGKIFAGMIPKLTNAFQALERGVKQVILGKADALPELHNGKTGTRLTYE